MINTTLVTTSLIITFITLSISGIFAYFTLKVRRNTLKSMQADINACGNVEKKIRLKSGELNELKTMIKDHSIPIEVNVSTTAKSKTASVTLKCMENGTNNKQRKTSSIFSALEKNLKYNLILGSITAITAIIAVILIIFSAFAIAVPNSAWYSFIVILAPIILILTSIGLLFIKRLQKNNQ